MLHAVWARNGRCTVDVGRAVIWKVVRIRDMTISVLVWLVLWGLLGRGSKCESILDNVRIIVLGLAMPSLILPLGGIGSTGDRVHLVLRVWPWRIAWIYECG